MIFPLKIIIIHVHINRHLTLNKLPGVSGTRYKMTSGQEVLERGFEMSSAYKYMARHMERSGRVSSDTDRLATGVQ